MSDKGLTTGNAHPHCMHAGAHICQKPSGRPCYEQPCDNPAGTLWGPYWCPEHDKERLDRISASFVEINAMMRPTSDVSETGEEA